MDSNLKATLILADAYPLVRKGLKTALENDFLILGIARNSVELLDLLKKQQPEIVLDDLQMPFMDGLMLAKKINILYPQIRTIVLSASYDFEIETKLKMAGVKGYLTKDVETDFLIVKIKQVLAGQTAFCQSNAKVHFEVNRYTDDKSISQYGLSSRELEIISLIRKGLTSEEIAKQLFISVNTVEAHRKHIFKKLNLRNVQGLVEFACNNFL